MTPWIIAGVLGVGGLAFYVKASGADKVSGEDRRPEATATLPGPAASNQKVHVVQPHSDGMNLSYTTSEKEAPNSEDPKVYAVNEYLHQIPAVDPKAHVLAITVKDRIANLSMSKEFGLSYGSEDEKLILDGLATTLGAIDGIDKFTLSADGQRIESLGHADLSDPMPVIKRDGGAMQNAASTPSKPR